MKVQPEQFELLTISPVDGLVMFDIWPGECRVSAPPQPCGCSISAQERPSKVRCSVLAPSKQLDSHRRDARASGLLQRYASASGSADLASALKAAWRLEREPVRWPFSSRRHNIHLVSLIPCDKAPKRIALDRVRSHASYPCGRKARATRRPLASRWRAPPRSCQRYPAGREARAWARRRASPRRSGAARR